MVPGESLLSALSDSRVAVYISNYTGELNATQTERLTETKRVLQNAGVAFIYGGYKKWFDFSSYDFQPDSDEELAARFNACFLHTCNRLHNGVLYACPHQYAGRNLGILSDCGDTVKLDGDDLIKALDEFKTRPFVDACKHCQMPFKAPVILAGEAL